MNTLFTRTFSHINLTVPIISAPMAFASGGLLAARVSCAGALGLIGSGYNETSDWILAEIATAKRIAPPVGLGNVLPFGLGYITWWLETRPGLLMDALEATRSTPLAAVWFSFGEYRPFLKVVRERSPLTKVIVQVGTVDEAVRAAGDGVDVIVVQGNEAGGHGKSTNSTTITLTPETVTRLRPHHPQLPIISAGGIADGRGLAASLSLGASGVCMGTRFMACDESGYPPGAKRAVVEGSDGGVSTVRTGVFDVLRGLPWPEGYDGRAVRNRVTEEEGMGIEVVREVWETATREGDKDGLGIFAGSGLGLVQDVLPAEIIVRRTMEEAVAAIRTASEALLIGPL
ncbi:putative 2-nitropropane dioxygenase [Jimgerdemannia flammicorona]|uniref:Putative 2-nitropropane dioxygenase n=1 Tax=Jimgerdemannia flammicorona TaxID=994334 RepID=A0A433QVF9_9FUNG|nr:putative 2-nitropropane dioxygenase [Jimgerdemannia flammicorona]